MKAIAYDCEACAKHDWAKDRLVCTIGHRPRFYLPRHDDPYGFVGWKRRCDDFAPKSQQGEPSELPPSRRSEKGSAAAEKQRGRVATP